MKTLFNWFILLAAAVLGVVFLGLAIMQLVVALQGGGGQDFLGNAIFGLLMGVAVVYEVKQIKKKRSSTSSENN